MSVNIKTPDGLKKVAGNADMPGIDAELSVTSKNPVQNAAITAALNGIKNSLGGITLSVTEAGLVRASWEDKEET